ncbi:MAG: DUF2784 domain-containing protein [Acidobacteriota bacterium]
MYVFLDKFFFVFHSVLIVFILFGWLWIKTRKAHLAVIILTALSWFGLGLFYGFGYCPSTDWHWQVRMKLGYYDMPPSYLTFLIKSITGTKTNKTLVDIMAVIFLFAAGLASVCAYIKDKKKRTDSI